MRLLLAAILVLFCTTLFAAAAPPAWDVDIVSWSAPQACSDGSAPANCVISSYQISTADSPTATDWTALGSVAGNVFTFTKATVTPGQHCYRIVALSAAGPGAAATPCGTTVKPQVTPGAPGVTSDSVAYEIRGTPPAALRVGMVDLGAPCDSSRRQTIAQVSYTGIDRKYVDLVNWPGNTKVLSFYARCS